MKEWFANLQPRERAIFGAGAFIGLLIVLWAGVLRPLDTRSEVLRDAVAAKQRLLGNLEQVGGQPSVSGNGTPGQDQTILGLVDNSAIEHGVELTRRRPDGPNGIQVTFGNASFDTLVAWLVELETESAVTVESASFTGTRQPGIVNGQLVLRR